jgi:hypothetical protein
MFFKHFKFKNYLKLSTYTKSKKENGFSLISG